MPSPREMYPYCGYIGVGRNHLPEAANRIGGKGKNGNQRKINWLL